MSAGSAAVIAKARAKYGGLLGLDEYKTLISKANVGEIVAQLKTYGDFCEDFSAVDNTVRRSQSERLMEKRLFRIYDELRKFCPGSKNKFYDFLLIQEEIKQIINAAMYTAQAFTICSFRLSGLSDEYLFLRYSGTQKQEHLMKYWMF
ncbi:MAG: V0D/AC39 family V-type ATPase subunit [[Eubacterium] siraeum]